jgi:hypothetical protein
MRAMGEEASAGDCRTAVRRSCAAVVEEMESQSPTKTHLGNG